MLAIGAGPALAASDTCPNAQVRALQFSTFLPDCRAYELVSPANKEGSNVAADPTMTQSAVSGEAIKWTSTKAFGDAIGTEVRGAEYVSQRGSEGWSTHSINPGQRAPVFSLYKSSQYQDFSDDLTKGVYWALAPVGGGHPNVEHVASLYLRTDVLSAPPGTYELLSDSATPLPSRPEFSTEMEIHFAAASADWSRITFETTQALTTDAANANPALPKLYEWHNGAVTLVGILPDGTVAEGSMAGDGAGTHFWDGGWTRDTISSDGSRIVFTAAPFAGVNNSEQIQAGDLYMRIDGKETIKLNVDERTEPDPEGPQPAAFWAATANESEIFFTTGQALTDDATSGDWHFYRYDLDAPSGKHLALLAQVATPEGVEGKLRYLANQDIAINGISADGSYVYFTVPVFNEIGEITPWLDVWHDGTIRRLVPRETVSVRDSAWGDTSRVGGANSFRVTPDGKTIAFATNDREVAKLVGYDNVHYTGPGYADKNEIYTYAYDSEKLTCVSCDPSGALPVGDADNTTNVYIDAMDIYALTEYMSNMYQDRSLSDDGRYIFFDTPDPLVPEDTNGRRDVYEYDTTLGRAELLSGGMCNCESTFVDASPDGSNAFFTTHQALVRADFDTADDVYDVRIGGGFVAQSAPLPAPCEGDDCQGPAKAAPAFSAPASSTFAGGGNVLRTAKVAAPTKRALTRAQKLARALRACHAKRRKRRHRCGLRARRRYGSHRSAKRASRRAGR